MGKKKDKRIWQGIFDHYFETCRAAKGQPKHFARRIIYFFKLNGELLQDPVYKRLYDETLDYRARVYMKEHPETESDKEELKKYWDLILGAEVKYEGEDFDYLTKEELDKYLVEIRALWRMERYQRKWKEWVKMHGGKKVYDGFDEFEVSGEDGYY